MDFVPTSVLKKCRNVFVPLITRLANMSFREGCFPTVFKKAQITPLVEKEVLDGSDPASYRQISNLNTISKTIERLGLARLRQHITQSDNFSSKQSAYRQHHSTETALLSILNDVYGKIDTGKCTLLVALDTVEHSVRLRRLENCFGVTGTAIAWIGSYLSDRSQFVRMDSSCSAIVNCSCGVPQSSVLGPLLFVAYTAPMSTVAENVGVQYHQYADDTQIYAALSREEVNETSVNLHNCLTAIHLWLSQNGLVVNPDKSEAVLFSTSQRSRLAPLPLSTVNVAGAITSITDSVKLLGITIDKHLTFNTHVLNVCKASYYHIRALKHIRSFLTEDVTRSIACALVNSRLDYSNSVLYGTSKTNLARLQRIQNSLARVVVTARRTDSIKPILERLHWLPIVYRIEYKVVTVAYKVRETGYPAYLKSAVVELIPNRISHSSDKHFFKQFPVKTEIARRAFGQAASSVMNSLPAFFRSIKQFIEFKKCLKTHFFKLAYPG